MATELSSSLTLPIIVCCGMIEFGSGKDVVPTPILIIVWFLAFGSLVKTPARSQATWISSSVSPLDRRNFCFALIELRWTLGLDRNLTAVVICNIHILVKLRTNIVRKWFLFLPGVPGLVLVEVLRILSFPLPCQ